MFPRDIGPWGGLHGLHATSHCRGICVRDSTWFLEAWLFGHVDAKLAHQSFVKKNKASGGVFLKLWLTKKKPLFSRLATAFRKQNLVIGDVTGFQ